MKLLVLNVLSFCCVIGELLECGQDYIKICNRWKACNECIRQHPCCNFCYDEVFEDGKRCSTEDDLKQRHCSNIENNYMPEVDVTIDEDLMDVNDSMAYAVQLKPQRFKLRLRPGDPQNITITYRPARNHPIDLYYLIDLTISMEKFLSTIKDLGANLIDHMKNITHYYRLGFGSYVDIPAMPFYRTDETHMKNPCRGEEIGTCEPGYIFKHHLNFTSDSKLFVEKVKERKISANLDKPEGGLEGLMQILLCEKQVSWKKNSRKFILLATDAPLHFAGEGFLAGAVKRNVDKCLLDSNGNYESLIYDYPSLEEVKNKLSEYKTNIIVATTSEGEIFYSEMKNILPHQMYVGLFEENFSNILKLIEDGYTSLIKRAVMKVGYTNPEDEGLLDIDVFSDCKYSGHYEKINSCDNISEGSMINITLQVGVNQFLRNKKTTIYIEERNIEEKTIIDVEFVGAYCSCENAEDTSSTCKNGEYRCHSCLCDPGWKGERCDEMCTTDLDGCRLTENGVTSISCFGHGDCICGKCECDYPYIGHPYCKYRCPVNEENQVCSNHGTCFDDTCKCDPFFIYDNCSYSTDTRNCVVPGTDIICNNHGTCENNRCVCDENYFGRVCENCETCNALCDVYKEGVLSMLETQNDTYILGNNTLMLFEVPYSEDLICHLPYDKNNTRCEVRYNYEMHKDNIDIKFNEQCGKGIQMSSIQISLITLAATIGIGLLGIIAYIIHIRIQDKREYAKFLEEQKKSTFSSEQNPIYKSPIRQYENIALKMREEYSASSS